jgi:Tetracyclin repressor-like, C-terminal domain
VSQYVAPRRATVWQVLQRGVERGELAADVDLAFINDLLVGPLFMRAVVWGQPLPPDAAEQTADVILTAFAPNAIEPRTERRTRTTHGPRASST